MSRLKKIFVVIACVLVVAVSSFLIVICNKKQNVGIALNNPFSITVFNKTVSGDTITDEQKIAGYIEVVSEVTNLTIYDRLTNGISLKDKLYLDTDGKFKTWSLDLLNKNLVIEVVYNMSQDLIVYEGDNPRVISFVCLAFVIPNPEEINEIAVYYSLISNMDSNERYNSYAENTPIILYGDANKLVQFVDKNS